RWRVTFTTALTQLAASGVGLVIVTGNFAGTFAGDVFERLAIQDLDVSTPVADEADALQAGVPRWVPWWGARRASAREIPGWNAQLRGRRRVLLIDRHHNELTLPRT